jgi:hypothetical protein
LIGRCAIVVDQPVNPRKDPNVADREKDGRERERVVFQIRIFWSDGMDRFWENLRGLSILRR